MNTETAGHDPIRLIVKRQEDPEAKPYWEEFNVAYQPRMNVVSALMEIRKNPVNAQGEPTTPVVWESVCLEEVCGACTMIINGTPRQACSALIDNLKQPIRLEPLTKFPLVRDLKVDRALLFEALKKTHAWIDIDGPFDLGPGPRMSAPAAAASKPAPILGTQTISSDLPLSPKSVCSMPIPPASLTSRSDSVQSWEPMA